MYIRDRGTLARERYEKLNSKAAVNGSLYKWVQQQFFHGFIIFSFAK